MWLGNMNVVVATIIANLIGGCIFFWVDRWIFSDKRKKRKAKKSAAMPAVATEEIVD